MTFQFDFKNPDYLTVAKIRFENLQRIRNAGPRVIEELKAYYRQSGSTIADFIEDFGVTYDPRNAEPENAERGLPANMPFILFPKQREYIEWLFEKWRSRKPGAVEKSRDGGISWLDIGFGCSTCVLFDGVRGGFGSRIEDYVDKINEPKSLFWKARFFMRHLPEEFRAGWVEGIHSPFMRMMFPDTGSSMVGEAGDNIGRGDRTSYYFFDEAAHHPQARKVEMALSQTTNCRIDVSSVNGMNNPFAEKRHSGRIDVFIWDWRDDPRKDQAWYDKQVSELDPIVVAQEIDRDYQASAEGVLIPAKWVRAAIDALDKLGLVASGAMGLAYDVADGGKDKNAVLAGKGVSVDFLDQWHGSKEEGDDIFRHVEKVFGFCDELGIPWFRYDGDGLGAGVRGDARIINERRKKQGLPVLAVEIFRGSGEILNPDREDVKGRTNINFFENRKAQAGWSLRSRFQRTFRWVTQGVACNPDEIISISSQCPGYLKLVAELSQPQFKTNGAGKIVIDKMPNNMASPNLFDACMMRFAGTPHIPLVVSDEMLQRIRAHRPAAKLRPAYRQRRR